MSTECPTGGSGVILKEVLPKQERVYDRCLPAAVLCKPKLLPLKSVTLDKLEKLQREAQEIIKKEEMLK